MAQTKVIESRSPRKISGLKLNGSPNKSWQSFKAKLDNFECTQVDSWEAEHVLGYVLKRYQEVFGTCLSLSYSGPPSKSVEMYCIKRTILAVDGDNPNMQIVKSYIDYVYDKIIIPKKTKIRKLSIFFTPQIVLDFKYEYKKLKRITRSTQLPKQYETIIHNMQLDDVQTYGDLAFVNMAVKSDPETNYKYQELILALESVGFNTDIFDTIGD